MSKSTQENLIQKKTGVCGGSAITRDTRIPVWTLVSLREQGASEQELLRNYPGLNQQDLEAAWWYYTQQKEEIDALITEGI